MNMSVEVLEVMGESADGSISPYVWGPALINAARQIKELQAALSTAEADRKALMEVIRKIVDPRDRSLVLCALPAHLRSEAEGKGTP